MWSSPSKQPISYLLVCQKLLQDHLIHLEQQTQYLVQLHDHLVEVNPEVLWPYESQCQHICQILPHYRAQYVYWRRQALHPRQVDGLRHIESDLVLLEHRVHEMCAQLERLSALSGASLGMMTPESVEAEPLSSLRV